jgi:hypothetical protein
VLETAAADQMAKVCGYSVRAASIQDRTRLEDEFRAVERLLSYELPSDTSPEHKRQLDATTAPMRLCFIPDINGRQVVCQVAYRTFDTANPPRVGSYFAHLLIDSTAQPWSALDCLRLWGISDPAGHHGWADTDRAVGFPDLAPLSSIADWLVPGQHWLGDDAASSFLRTGNCSQGSPTNSTIPARWAKQTAESDRISLIEQVLQAILEKHTLPTAILAIEPAVAAVCFYAALRLVPNKLRTGVSFSTYEPDPTRAAVRLAATTFLGSGGDFKPQAYQSESLVINTFRGPPFEAGGYKPFVGAYAKWAVQRLAKGDMTRINELHRSIDSVWTSTGPSAAELNQLPVLEDVRTNLFRGKAVAIPAGQTDATRRFLAERCGQSIRKHISELSRQPAGVGAALIKKLEAVFSAAPQQWNQLKQHGEIAAWLKSAQPLHEDGVLGKLSQPASMLSDADAVQLIVSCECVTKEHRLPRVSTRSQRLWGDPKSLQADTPYAVQPLFQQVLRAIEPERLSRILPEPLPKLQVVLAIVLALQAELDALPDDVVAAPQYRRIKAHLRRVLDDAAGGPSEVGASGAGVSDDDFENLLQAAEGCCDHYDPAPGAFGVRINKFIAGFRERVPVVCVDERLINLAYNWSGCATDHGSLQQQIRGWKTILSWFANMWDQSGKVPFKRFWRPSPDEPSNKIIAHVREAAFLMVPGAGPTYDVYRKKVLYEIVKTFSDKGWLRPEKKGLSGMFANNDGATIRRAIDHVLTS